MAFARDEDLIFPIGDDGGGFEKPAGAVVRITAEEIPLRFARHFEMAIATVRRAAFDTAQRGVAYAVRLAKSEDLVYMGAYIRAFSARQTPEGAIMYNDAPYAHVIEYGRRPMQPGPPLAPIAMWVRIKLGIDDPNVAWLIRKAIHEKGTRPRRIMAQAREQMVSWFLVDLARRLRAI